MQQPPVILAEDYVTISDLLARYCWSFDEGDADAYAALWDGEGEMLGFGEPIKGMAALRKVVQDTYSESQGKMRHVLTNLTVRYGPDANSATAKGYNLVTRWAEGGRLLFNVLETFELQRSGAGWRLVRVHLNITQ